MVRKLSLIRALAAALFFPISTLAKGGHGDTAAMAAVMGTAMGMGTGMGMGMGTAMGTGMGMGTAMDTGTAIGMGTDTGMDAGMGMDTDTGIGMAVVAGGTASRCRNMSARRSADMAVRRLTALSGGCASTKSAAASSPGWSRTSTARFNGIAESTAEALSSGSAFRRSTMSAAYSGPTPRLGRRG